MAEIEKMIEQCRDAREFHKQQRDRGCKGAGIEALACAIRERALRDAKLAILRERSV